MPEVMQGRYQHFKGGLYDVIGTARNTESGEDLVIYRSAEGSAGLWARPVSLFTGSVEKGSDTVPRFRFLG